MIFPSRLQFLNDPQLIEAMWECSMIGLAVVSKEGVVLHANPALCKILGGYTEGELQGMHFKEFTLGGDVKADIQAFSELVNGDRMEYEMTKTWTNKTGFPVAGEMRVNRLPREDGSIQYLLSQVIPRIDVESSQVPSTVEISAGKLLGQALAENKKLIGTLLAALIGAITTLTVVAEHIIKLFGEQ